jgi:hypothetical protein
MNGLRAAAAVMAVVAMPVGLWAGEALQLSNARSHPDPSQKSTLPGASSRLGLKFGSYGPMDGPTSGPFRSNRRDLRAERKAQNAEDEKKNWMVLDRGQLDAEDEDTSGFGIKKYDLENKNTKRDYFFAPPEEKGDRAGNPRQQAGRRNNRVPPEGSANEASRTSDQDDNDAKGNPSVSKDGRPVGDHVSKELDMKDLLAPGKANSIAPTEDRTTKLWKEILGSVGSGSTSESRAEGPGQRGDGAVADGFRPSASGSTPAQSSAFSVGFRNDFSARPAAGGTPSLSGSASAGFAPAAPMTPRIPDSSANRPPAPPTADRAPTPNDSYSARSSSFGSGSAGSSFGQPPPRRPSSSSFEIPARPGYGGR